MAKTKVGAPKAAPEAGDEPETQDKPKGLKFDIEKPRQFKSSNSSNIYTSIAEDANGREVGISINRGMGGQGLMFRFCLFTNDPPSIGTFVVRGGSKPYLAMPLKDATINGYPLDKIYIPVLAKGGADPLALLNALGESDGWEVLASWVEAALEKEKFKPIFASHEEFVVTLPQIMVGIGLEAPENVFEVPPSIGTTTKVKAGKPKPVADDDFDPNADFDDDDGAPNDDD